jgi:hypothetical protein
VTRGGELTACFHGSTSIIKAEGEGEERVIWREGREWGKPEKPGPLIYGLDVVHVWLMVCAL